MVGALIVTGLVLMFTIGIHHDVKLPATPEPTFVVELQKPQPGAAVPRTGLAAPPDRPKVSDQAELDAWAQKVSSTTRIPARVLAAYGRADMWMRAQKPACQLSWVTLAGILNTTQCHQPLPVGASGSYMVTAKLLAPVGTPLQPRA